MFDLKKEWSISFAGCGFMGIYYVGAASCIFERFPPFIQNASKIYGASAGALMATILTIGMPLEKSCLDIMYMAKEARKRKLGPLHPAFNPMQIVRDSLLTDLPHDAHTRASGKLCVSLTRMSDGKNVIVSEYDTREELIQALICSCFIPLYSGVIPPTYRGVRYMDGAISNNLPRCHMKNTITFSAFAGESDVCPRVSTPHFHEVRFNNVSIQVTTENMYRVTSIFYPPEPEIMAEICHSGYLDAFRFLQESGFISGECILEVNVVCCELVEGSAAAEETDSSKKQPLKDPNSAQGGHWWLDRQVIKNLPAHIKRALCKACREKDAGSSLLFQVTELLPGKVASYLRLPCTLPMETAYMLANRLAHWIPGLSRDMSWLYGMVGPFHKRAENEEQEGCVGDLPLRRCTSLPLGLNSSNQRGEEFNYPLTPEATPTPTYGPVFSWETSSDLADHLSLTPPPTPTVSHASVSERAKGWSLSLSRTMGWLRHMGSEQALGP